MSADQSQTRVVNLRNEPYDVYIGRPGRGLKGPFGNPIRKHDRCAECGRWHITNGDTLPCYEKHLQQRIEADPLFRDAVRGLAGKRLGCFCAPNPCHGDILARYADALAQRDEPSSERRAL